MNGTDSYKPIREAWHAHRIQAVALRHYSDVYTLDGARRIDNTWIDAAAINLLLINLSCVLDGGLDAYIVAQGWKPKKDILFERINLLASMSMLKNDGDLHELRGARNDIAHDLKDVAYIAQKPDWKEYDRQELLVGETLLQLGVLPSLPKYEFCCQRDAATESKNPRGLCDHKYTITIKRNGKAVSEQSTTWTMMADE